MKMDGKWLVPFCLVAPLSASTFAAPQDDARIINEKIPEAECRVENDHVYCKYDYIPIDIIISNGEELAAFVNVDVKANYPIVDAWVLISRIRGNEPGIFSKDNEQSSIQLIQFNCSKNTAVTLQNYSYSGRYMTGKPMKGVKIFPSLTQCCIPGTAIAIAKKELCSYAYKLRR